MNKLTVLCTAILAVLLLAGPSFAGGIGKDVKTSDAAVSGVYTGDQLVGLSVIDREGEVIGKIKEVNLNSETGVINYVVLAERGYLGIGEERHAVPLEALEISLTAGTATLIVTEDKLEGVPERAMGMTDEEYRGVIQRHYGVAPAWEEGEVESEKTLKKEEKRGYSY